ncbi:MAG: sulfatase-like hydrolase/transferase [Fimbriimonas sp.]|nr:sulfatase-like hydrolase/transferase [Fimbriimonas sp.]
MNRRAFIGSVASGLAAAGSSGGVASVLELGLSSVATGSDERKSRPNILFIIADDLMFRTIRALNNHEIHTPNLDRLAQRGCAFTHCFHQGSWSGAVCIPSRTMLNSGLSAFHAEHGIERVRLWGQTFGAAGYRTAICGKWHLDPVELGRSFRENVIVAPGFLESTPENGDAYHRPHAGDTWDPSDLEQKGHWIHTNLWLDESPDRVEHSSELYANQAIRYLTHVAPSRKQPFFLYIGFNAPHDPRQAPKEFLDLYPEDKIEIPPNYLPSHPFDQGDAKVRDEVLAPFPRTEEAVRLHRREYYAIISHLDHEIGRILDALEHTGQAANTYVILTADHGLAVGEHGLFGKQNLYDCSVRMPLLISGPGVPAGRRVDELVYQHSMYATTCELAGIPAPSTVEFPSLVPLLRGDAPPEHDAVFCYYLNYQRSVRTKTHKLIVYPKARRMQLFDVEHDPWEIHDLSQDPASAPIKSVLVDRLRRFQKELDDPLDIESLLSEA